MSRDAIRSRGATRLPILLPVVSAVVSAVAIGAAAGLGFFTFGYADGASYLGDDPEACANCHVMQGHLDAWVKSSHKHVATCNDCHAPHDPIGKYLTKAVNGFNHSLAFTIGDFPQNLRITEWNRAVTEGACRSCHAELTHSIDVRAVSGRADEPIVCMRCHENVGHLR